jgi:hypothetical protein
VKTIYAFNLSRIWQHYERGNFAIVSAYLGDDPDNHERAAALKKAVRAHGYGYVEIEGHWTEMEGPDRGKSFVEYPLFIPAISRKDALYFGSGEYYDDQPQYSIIYADDDTIYMLKTLDGSGASIADYPKLQGNFQKSWNYYSRHKGKSWRYAVVKWNMIEPPPTHPEGWAEHMAAYTWKDTDAHEFYHSPK